MLSPGLSEPRAHISLHLAEALYWAARRGLLQPASLLPRALQLLDTVARWAGIGHVAACSALIGPAAHVTACSALIGPAAHVSACSAVIGPCPGCGGTTGPAPRRATRWSTLAGSGRRSWSTLEIVIFNKSFYNFFVEYFEEKIIEQQIWTFLKYLVTKTLIYKYSLSCLFKQKWSNILNLHSLCSIKFYG